MGFQHDNLIYNLNTLQDSVWTSYAKPGVPVL